MASTWIKVRSDIATTREVLIVADQLQCSMAEAVGLCVIFWTWADGQTDNGKVEHCSFATVDKLVQRTGFADAMKLAGWLEPDPPSGIFIPNFDRHMGRSGKARTLSNRRQAAWRERSGK